MVVCAGDQQVDGEISGIDVENQQMTLSIKDLEPNSWDNFVASHKAGDVVKGKIARFASFGAFVELGDNLEGLCHISELSDERIAKPEDAAEIGKEMEFRILRIDSENKKIGLSARAARHDEPIVETKTYTSEAKGGMASLGELADFGIASKADDKANDKADEKANEKADEKVDEKADEPADEKADEKAGAEPSEG